MMFVLKKALTMWRAQAPGLSCGKGSITQVFDMLACTGL